MLEAKRDLAIDFRLNATDKMQNLLEELRAEDDQFKEMDELFRYTLDGFADVNKFKYPPRPC